MGTVPAIYRGFGLGPERLERLLGSVRGVGSLEGRFQRPLRPVRPVRPGFQYYTLYRYRRGIFSYVCIEKV